MPANPTNTVQRVTISGAPTGGTFPLSLGVNTTAPVAYNADAAAIQSALEALPVVGAGNVTVTGGAFPNSPATVTFTPAVVAHFVPNSIPLLTANTSQLTGPAGATFAFTAENVPGNVPPGASVTLTSSAVQQLSVAGSPTGGTLVLGFGGQTVSVPWDATWVQVSSSLTSLPGIGSGNLSVIGGPLPGLPITVTFTGTLAGTAQPLITVDASGLTGGKNVSAEVKSLQAGGRILGPVAFDNITGTATINGVTAGTWTWTITAPNYIDASGSLNVICPPSTALLVNGITLVAADGYILQPGSNTPTLAPATAALSGDPAGCSTLNLATCTGGIAFYLGTAGPQTFDARPAIDRTFVRQSWFVASFGCGEITIRVIWTIQLQGFTSVNCITAKTLGGADCGPASDFPGNNTGCPDGYDFCSCANSWWPSFCTFCTNGITVGYHSYTQENCPDGVTPLVLPYAYFNGGAYIWGGGCFVSTQLPSDPTDPNSPLVPGWTATAVNQQIGTLWGEVFNTCRGPGVGIYDIPQVTASL